MFKFLFIMFFMFLLLLFLMGFSILRSFKRLFFGEDNRRANNTQHQGHRSGQASSSQEETRRSRTGSSRKKIFTHEDGEYVDYEEVK